MAWRRRWLVVCPLVLGLFVALIVSAKLPNIYQSDMLIQIIPQRVPDRFVPSTVTLRAEERLQSLSQQVMSRTVLEQLITELDLYRAPRARLPMQDVVELMRLDVQVEAEAPRRGPRGPQPADAFHVRFTYHDPTVAARVTQRLGSLFVDQNARDRGALAEATNDFLETQLAEARSRLESQEQKLEAFRQRHAGRLPSQLDFNLQAINNAQLQLQALVESIARDRDRKLILERLYSDARSEPVAVPAAPATATLQAADPAAAPSNTSPQQQLEIARAALARLELRLQPEHPDIIRTKRQIADLEKQVESSAQTSAAPAASQAPPPPRAITVDEQARRERIRQMRAEIESLERQIAFKDSEERRLRGVIADHQQRIEAVPGLESEWLTLTRGYDTQQLAYRDLLTKSEASKVAVNLERRQIGEQFRILDPARVPIHPIGPFRLKINAIGAGIGLALGLGLLALLEIRDSTFHTEADITAVLGLPVLAVVPEVESAAEQVRRRRVARLRSAAAMVAIGAGGYVFWTMRLWNFIA